MPDPRPGLKLELETVTPLFLSGAEPRSAPELRAPSFRGALRYWLRAALGGCLGDDEGVVSIQESAVFGSAAEETGHASAVVLRTTHSELPPPEVFDKRPSTWVRKGGKELRQPTGRDYLFWSMAESGKVEYGNFQPAKQYYPPGMHFNLILGVRPGAPGAEAAYRRALAACWLLLNFGGLGSRSRRCAGSLTVQQEIEVNGLRFGLNASRAGEQLAAGLAQVRSEFAVSAPPHFRIPPQFDILHPDHCRVWVLGTWDSSEHAVEAIGAALRDFRTYREPDHGQVAGWLQGKPILTVERSVFGLPIPYRYSNGGPSGTVQARSRDAVVDRRASPLWLKVSKTTDGRYVGVATLFKSAFLGPGDKLYAKTRGSTPTINPPADYALIEQFVQSLASAREVRYV